MVAACVTSAGPAAPTEPGSLGALPPPRTNGYEIGAPTRSSGRRGALRPTVSRGQNAVGCEAEGEATSEGVDFDLGAMSRHRSKLLAGVLAAWTILYAPTASAAEPEPTNALPRAFELRATNGYRAYVLAGGEEDGRAGMVLGLGNRHGDVDYSAPAHLTETTMEAKFGKLGEIDVHAVPAGHPTIYDPRCGSGGKKQMIESGRWEGTIRFRGEEGFAAIAATGAASDVGPFVRLV